MLKALLNPAIVLLAFTGPVSAGADIKEQQANQMAKALGKEACPLLHQKQRSKGFDAEQFTFTHRSKLDDADRTYILFRVPCWLAAYNQGDAYVLFDSYGEAKIVPFAVPSYEVTYTGDDYEKVASINVTGYRSKWSIVFSNFDTNTLEISEFNKSRGLGDAFTTGVWRFENGDFVLKTYSVDGSYDGQAEAKTIVNFEAPQ